MADGTFTVGAGNMNAFESGVDISEALAEEADIRQVFFKSSAAHAAKHGQFVI